MQGYTAQAIVTTDQCIVSAEVTQEEYDVHQFAPMVEAMNATRTLPGSGNVPRALAADAGYWHDQVDVAQVEKDGPELFIAALTCSPQPPPHDSRSPIPTAFPPVSIPSVPSCRSRSWQQSLGQMGRASCMV